MRRRGRQSAQRADLRAFAALLSFGALCGLPAACDDAAAGAAHADAARAMDAGAELGCTEELLRRYDALVDGGRMLLAEPTAVLLYLNEHRELIETLGERCLPEVCVRMHATFAWCIEDATGYLIEAGFEDELDGGMLLDAFCVDPPPECAPFR